VIEGEDIATRRFAAYLERRNLRLARFLGSGKDGVVYEVESNAFPLFAAVKSFYHFAKFERERDVYLRLRELKTREVRDFAVPQLVAWDDGLMAIEMTMVGAPCILDFADAWLDDDVPEFPDEVWADWHRKLDEDFEGRAAEVRRILAVLSSHGVMLLDVHPGNIRFS